MGAERGRIPELAPGHLCAAMPSVMECDSPAATELTDVTLRAQGFYLPSAKGGQPWHRSESQSDGILSYL